MCIAILNKKVAGELSSDVIYNSWENNNMGGGLLWNKNGKLASFKTYDYNEFYDMYRELRSDDKVDNIVLHFRIATSGIQGIHNLHPFMVSDSLGFVHNGVISGLGNKDYSDTYQFNDMLKGFSHDFVSCNTTQSFIEEYIGYSKLIFLKDNGEYNIFNEKLGHWSNSNWFSNDSYKAVNDYSYYGNKKIKKAISKSMYTNVEKPIMTEFETEMFNELCEEFLIDAKSEYAWDDIEIVMEEYNASDLYSLYDVVFFHNSNYYIDRYSDGYDF